MRFGLLCGAIALALVAACATREPVRFPHLEHLTQLECGLAGQPECLDCASCHEANQRGGFVEPQPTQCAGCHRHPRQILAESRLPEPTPAGVIRFGHERHLEHERIRGQCVGCHAGVASADPRSPTNPPMDTCLSCHRTEFERAQCNDCHPSSELALAKPVTFMRHDASWIEEHGTAAAQSGHICTSCHAESTCTDCHDLSQTLKLQGKYPEAIFRAMPHRGDFVARHAIEARTQPGACLSCHAPSSCDSCHVSRGVSANAVGASNPHPPGWMGRNTTSRSFHGRAARRDLLSCAGCHDQGPRTNCIQCHRPGAPGGSPHPNNWLSSQSQSSPMCRFCHE